jgi:hypothetical protein
MKYGKENHVIQVNKYSLKESKYYPVVNKALKIVFKLPATLCSIERTLRYLSLIITKYIFE